MYLGETTVLQERVQQFMEVAKDLRIRQLCQTFNNKVEIRTGVEEVALDLGSEVRRKDFVNENKVELPDLCKSKPDDFNEDKDHANYILKHSL